MAVGVRGVQSGLRDPLPSLPGTRRPPHQVGKLQDIAPRSAPESTTLERGAANRRHGLKNRACRPIQHAWPQVEYGAPSMERCSVSTAPWIVVNANSHRERMVL
jgi:hypothetical protein